MHLPPNIVEKSPDVYVFTSKHPVVGLIELHWLIQDVASTSRKRRRLCIHNSDEAWIQEMVVAYCKDTYMRPNRHPFDESLHLIYGYGDLFFFDSDGHITEAIPLNAFTNRTIRIRANTYHKLIIRSPVMVIHELIPGPFRKGITTEPAPWSPEEDSADISEFHRRLEDYLNGK